MRSIPGLESETRWVDNSEGWDLELHRYVAPGRLDPRRRPLLLVPGYAMNSFILGYHPRDVSMIAHLALEGYEVWTSNLRGQGGSRDRVPRPRRYGMGELSLVDLPRALEHVRAHSRVDATRIDLVGCSLGASLVYAWLAWHPQDHGVGSVVAIGGPLRWVEVHPAMRLAFHSPAVAGMVPIRGTRAMARRALPIVKHMPSLLALYMNAGMIDLSQADQLVNTVDDPVRHINRQVAHWVRERDLRIRGRNVTEGLREVDVPVLVVLANRDGIVPAATARSVQEVMPRVELLEVGDDSHWFAHADLFISDQARARVFEPMGRWLAEKQG